MDTCCVDCGRLPAVAHLSQFAGADGVSECHLTVRPTAYASIESQLDVTLQAYHNALDFLGLNRDTAVLRRFFCSDVANQAGALEARPFANPRDTEAPCAVSWVGQAPAPPAKVALWAYHLRDAAGPLTKTLDDHTVTLRRGDLTHHWTTGVVQPDAESSYDQTLGILAQYEDTLRGRGLSLAEDVVRTWLFVRDIDTHYQGMVKARREIFAERGLTAATHFIASTGVEGQAAQPGALVSMDAHAMSGLRPGQVAFLAAPKHLSPTHIYGVTFERGATISYRDRRHVLISGTASIDEDGHILHLGDVGRQLDRALENIAALLQEGGATFEDVGAFIVYVRDPSDLVTAEQQMRARFGHTPMTVVVGPVCRPGWLIEVECEAVVAASSPEMPRF
jgi:enamine deaminase RidA (YjgF/YER057c/UK114 family)